MPTSDPLDILLAHDEWATRELLATCESLSPTQFHQPFEMGPGSLHATTTHILAAMRIWTDRLAGRDARPRLDQDQVRRTPSELMRLLPEFAADLAQVAREHPLDATIAVSRDGKTFSLPRGGVLTHVTTHGMHHRAQCLNMLRQMGVSPLPASSVVDWMRNVNGGR